MKLSLNNEIKKMRAEDLAVFTKLDLKTILHCEGLDPTDCERCFQAHHQLFKLYKNTPCVRDNIHLLYDEKYFGIFPIWKMLFEVHYPLYEQGIHGWKFWEQTSQLEAIKLLNENNITYVIEDKTVIYEVDGVEYKILENTKSSEKIADKILKEENTKKLEDYCEKYQNAKTLTKEDLEAIFEIGKHKMHDYIFTEGDFKDFIDRDYNERYKAECIKRLDIENITNETVRKELLQGMFPRF